MTLGEYLRDLRKATGLSQNGLAREAGVNVAYINRIENGQNVRPSRQIVFCLARILRLGPLSTDRLLYLAGLAPVEDWQTRALQAEASLIEAAKMHYRMGGLVTHDYTGDSTPPEDRYRSGHGQ